MSNPDDGVRNLTQGQLSLPGELMQKRLSYWQKKLAGAPLILELPADHPRPAVRTYRCERQYSVPSVALWSQLKALGEQEKATPFMTFLAAFYVWLHRYTGQTDLLVGTPFSNREMAETEGLIGSARSMIVLRVDLSGNPSFRELLGRVRESTLDACANYVPFEKLVQELQPESDSSRNPLFQVTFLIGNSHDLNVGQPDLTVRPVGFESGNSDVDLMLGISDDDKTPAIIFEYSTDLFEDGTIDRMLSNFVMLLEGIVAAPEKRLTDLPLLTPGETTLLLEGRNNTGYDYPRNKTLQRLFEEQVARTPKAVALIFEAQQLSYAELNERANRVARQLRSMGVGAGMLVGLYFERSLEMLVGMLGILKAGGAYVPLDPSYPPERLSYMLKDANIEILLTQNRLPSPAPDSELRRLCLDSDWEVIAGHKGENLSEETVSESLAYVIYTSGSTGKPKGVQIPHRAVVNMLDSMSRQPGLAEVDTVLARTKVSFDMSVFELFLPLVVGARLVIAGNEVVADGVRLSQMLATCGATAMVATPATWLMLIEAGWQGQSGLKILCGGEAMSGHLANQLLERGAELWNLYGPTETAVWSSLARVHQGDDLIVIGGAINNTQLYVLDRNFCLAPIGVAGELYIGGLGLAAGYLNRPDLTAEKFIPHPFSQTSGARLYRTGDVARVLSDGNLEFLGRLDHQVKLRGYRIELGEIESVLNEHPVVSQAVVTVKDDPVGQRLVAYIVPNTQCEWLEESSAETPIQVEQLSQWRTIWEETYHESSTHTDPTFNIGGWNSSYTGEQIPEAEMHEWVDRTVERILALEPDRVLEIGSGLGLLLFRLAPHCRRYAGIDFSPYALNYVQQELQKLEEDFSHVTLSQRAADDLDNLDDRAFNAVIINSVIQYFPNADYLLRVLERAVQAVDKGFVFVGDVRNLRLLKAFHVSVELHRAPATLLVANLLKRVQEHLDDEEELCIDPAFFETIKQRLPRVSRVEIQLKRGRYHNEMSCFRYDVVLHIGVQPHPSSDEVTLNWQTQNLELSVIRQLLSEDEPEVLRLEQVPNARLRSVVETLKLLENADCPKLVGELREAISGTVDNGIEIEDVWTMSAGLPYAVEIGWSDSGNDDYFNVVFRRRTSKVEAIQYRNTVASDRSHAFSSPERFASNPSQSIFNSRVASRLRAYAKEKLPEYMVPSSFILLRNFPLTPNGKVDRQSLPALAGKQLSREKNYVIPRTPLENSLADIWAEVLQLEKVGADDNFFELGGHSLTATRIVSQIRDRLQMEISLQEFFNSPTVAELAQRIENGISTEPRERLSSIVRAPRVKVKHPRKTDSLATSRPG